MTQLKLVLTVLSVMLYGSVMCQPSLKKMKAKLDLLDPAGTGLKMNMIGESQAGILFSPGNNLSQDQLTQWLGTQLGLRQGVDLLSPEKGRSNTGKASIEKTYQYFKGIKVEHGVINTTSRDGKVAMMHMEYYSIDDKFKTSPVLSEKAALQKAVNFINADVYRWTGYTGNNPEFMEPRGELVIISTYKQPGEVCLAYKFEIFALKPVSRAFVYVNAMDGTVVLNDARIKHAKRNRSQSEGTGGKKGTGIPETKRNAGSQADKIAKFNGLRDQPVNIPQIKGAVVNDAFNNIRQKANTPLANVTGTADTRYVGRQEIGTDDGGPIPSLRFRLRHTTDHYTDIVTLNYNRQPFNVGLDYAAVATDFLDNDNNWTAGEHNNVYIDEVAFDVQFNMKVITDYWFNIHHRYGWDDREGDLVSYVHVREGEYDDETNLYTGNNLYYDNACWTGRDMYFGDGSGDLMQTSPLTSLDICAHEIGHAITQATCNLVYQWESGALNESFSDIWAACVTHYAKINFSGLANEDVWRVGEKCQNLHFPEKGIRDMRNPALYFHPSTYKNNLWTEASLETCGNPVEDNDYCGVHSNSGVLNKWFFLITEGENSFNSFGTLYNITGLGFEKSQEIAYLMSTNLTPNASYATAKTVSINAATILYGSGSVEVQTVKDAWKAVAVVENIFNMTNTPIFTTNNFTSIAVDKAGDVWAGTNYNGLYRYTNSAWQKRTEVPNVRINDIKADKNGNIWIAQSGTQTGGTRAVSGGVNYLRAPYGPADNTFYTNGAQIDLPSRNARCIFVDTSRVNDGVNPKVWAATLAYANINTGNSMSGMLAQGVYSTGRGFINVNEGLNIASNTAGVLTVGGNKSEIWTFAQANNGINQLLAYNAGTNALITYYDHNTDPILPSGFIARAIYGDAKNRIWFSLNTNILIVLDESQNWNSIELPAGTQGSFNAICGNSSGDVYVGTNKGILFFESGDGLMGRLSDPGSYSIFAKENGLLSNVINALAYDTVRFKLMVATDSGVIFSEPFCRGRFCETFETTLDVSSESVGPGNWSNPAIWSNNRVPDSLTNVTMKHDITVDINGRCKTLTVLPPGSVTVNTGFNLTLYVKEQPIILGVQKRKGGVITQKQTGP